MTATKRVTYERSGDVAVLKLDDGKANAVSHELIAELREALGRAREEAGAVMLVGRPGRFSGGFDLSVMTAGIDQARALVRAGGELLLDLYTHPQPVVAVCTGHALAAGALLLLTADRRLGVSGDFKIGLNEVAIGLPLPVYALELARERLSKRHFAPATVLARIYSPAEACDAGYLDAVVDSQHLMDAALAEAVALAALPASALAQTKQVAREAMVERVRATLDEDMRRVAPPANVRKS
jgi:enoyl-CoA hydratase